MCRIKENLRSNHQAELKTSNMFYLISQVMTVYIAQSFLDKKSQLFSPFFPSAVVFSKKISVCYALAHHNVSLRWATWEDHLSSKQFFWTRKKTHFFLVGGSDFFSFSRSCLFVCLFVCLFFFTDFFFWSSPPKNWCFRAGDVPISLRHFEVVKWSKLLEKKWIWSISNFHHPKRKTYL